jgi:acetyl esterase/lipase
MWHPRAQLYAFLPQPHPQHRPEQPSKQQFVEARFGHVRLAARKKAEISPLYADLQNLPPAQSLVGDIEPLLGDSLFMAAKWAQAGVMGRICML